MPSRTGWIHVATTTRKYKGKVYRTHLLRHTYRVGRQVKHETLGNISHLPEPLIEIIQHSLDGGGDGAALQEPGRGGAGLPHAEGN